MAHYFSPGPPTRQVVDFGAMLHAEDVSAEPSQLAAYSLIESFLGWFGGLGSLWGGLTPMVARCVGQGDEEGAGRLLKMSFVCCFFAAAIAWGIVFPFGGMIVKAAFDPTEATYYYVSPRDDA